MRRLLAVVLVAVFLPLQGFAASFAGKVVKVSDGDTIQVLDGGKAVKIRLAEIDCPETSHGPGKPGQPFGQAAKKYVLDLVGGKPVRVDVVTRDRYGRVVGKVILDDGSTLNKRLVGAGLAWVYRRYAKDPSLFDLEAEARAAKLGLWSDPNPVAPWEWRHGAGWGKKTADSRPSPAVVGQSGRCGEKRRCSQMSSCQEAIFFWPNAACPVSTETATEYRVRLYAGESWMKCLFGQRRPLWLNTDREFCHPGTRHLCCENESNPDRTRPLCWGGIRYVHPELFEGNQAAELRE